MMFTLGGIDMKRIAFLGALFLAIAISLPAWACTVTLTGKKATLDGSVMVSHSDDGLSDARMIYIPAMNHKPGSLRPVFYAHYALDYKPQWGASETQRIMTRDRGPGYDTPGVPPSVPLGYIPQALHTLSLIHIS